MAFVILGLPTSIHLIFRILIAFLIFGGFTVLLSHKIIGKILNVLLGCFWASGLYALLNGIFNGYFTKKLETDKLSWIIWIVAMGAVCIGVHFASAKDMGIGEDEDLSIEDYQPQNFQIKPHSSQGFEFSKQYLELVELYDVIHNKFKDTFNIANDFMESITDNEVAMFFYNIHRKYLALNEEIQGRFSVVEEITESAEHKYIITTIRTKIDVLEAYNKEVQDKLNQLLLARKEKTISEPCETKFSFFSGCDTLEKLKTRYKQLSRAFHPDLGSGDTESMQLLNMEYEILKDEFEKVNN